MAARIFYPRSQLPTSLEVVVAAGVVTIKIGQINAWAHPTQDPEDAIIHTPVIHKRNAARPVRQIWANNRPLTVAL